MASALAASVLARSTMGCVYNGAQPPRRPARRSPGSGIPRQPFLFDRFYPNVDVRAPTATRRRSAARSRIPRGLMVQILDTRLARAWTSPSWKRVCGNGGRPAEQLTREPALAGRFSPSGTRPVNLSSNLGPRFWLFREPCGGNSTAADG